LSGREPEGIVAQGKEFTQVRARICQALHHWSDPDDGRPVVSAVYKADELFHGPNVGDAPDLVVVMRDLAYITRQGCEFGHSPGSIFVEPSTHESGGHRIDGVLITSGPGFASFGYEMPVASLMDVTPTVLHLLGCPVLEEMDGRVLSERLSPSWATRPVKICRDDEEPIGMRPGAELSVQEEEELLDRLHNLGYIA
jgi:predicted AlkP superfamily phosphohydrolase/phosphomutase